MPETSFEWNEDKNLDNQQKHSVSFEEAQYAFMDEARIVAEDLANSQDEKRYFCFGMNRDRSGILTVRFTFRKSKIRIFGAGYSAVLG
jgi:uncharacterized DUF497 family protein